MVQRWQKTEIQRQDLFVVETIKPEEPRFNEYLLKFNEHYDLTINGPSDVLIITAVY